MQQTTARTGGGDMSWPRAVILATGFFFISAIYLGQIPSFFSLVFTQANLHTMSQSMLTLGLLTVGLALIAIAISFMYDPKPVLPIFPPLFGLIGLGILGAGAVGVLFVLTTGHQYFPDQTIQRVNGNAHITNWPNPDHGWFLDPKWFQPQSVDIGAVSFVALMIGGGLLSYALLYYPWSRGKLTPALTNWVARLCAVGAGAFVLAYLTAYTFNPGATTNSFLAGVVENFFLGLALGLVLFALQLWLLPVMTAPGNRQKYMPNMYLHGVMLLTNVAAPLLTIFVVVYPLVNLLQSVDLSHGYWVQCAVKTSIPDSCTFTSYMGYIVAAVVSGMLFTFMIAAGYLWKRKPGFVKSGSTFAFVFAALAVVSTHMSVNNKVSGTPIALALAVGIVIMGLIWTIATEREFLAADQRSYALGCTGQWLMWGTLLFVYMGAFAFFSYPNFLDTEGNLIVTQGPHTLHDAYWVMLLCGGLAAIHFAFLMRRQAIGNVRKSALWFVLLGAGLQVTAAISLRPNHGLGFDFASGDSYANLIYWGGVAVEVLGILAAAYGGVASGGMRWTLTTFVFVFIGIVGFAYTMVPGNQWPDVLVAFSIIAGVGPILYAIYGKDAPAPVVGRMGRVPQARMPLATTEPGLPE